MPEHEKSTDRKGIKQMKNLKGDIDILEDLRIAAMKPLDRMLEMTGEYMIMDAGIRKNN